MKNFEKLGIDKNILKVIKELEYEQPTLIQEKAIPLIIEGKDLTAQSATGTGKTFAFLASIISKINNKNKLQAMIIVPTRELALQVAEEAKILCKYNKLRFAVVYGGHSIRFQQRDLRSANIVIATPGRLLDHIDRRNIDLRNIKHLVLDEADRMSDMGFIKDIKKILKALPKEKQILLFSATLSRDVSTIEKYFMKNPERIYIKSTVDHSKLAQNYYKIDGSKKLSLLIHLLETNDKKAIIFCNTRNMVDVVKHNLKEHNITAYKLHGGLDQKRRTKTIALFQNNPSAVLVSTDVAARGIHVDDVYYIYNYDMPKEKNQYIHRIGRTARIGNEGEAISLLLSREVNQLLQLAKKYKFNIDSIKIPDFKFLTLKKPEPEKKSNNRRRPSFNDRKNRVRRKFNSFDSKDRKRSGGRFKKSDSYKKNDDGFKKRRRSNNDNKRDNKDNKNNRPNRNSGGFKPKDYAKSRSQSSSKSKSQSKNNSRDDSYKDYNKDTSKNEGFKKDKAKRSKNKSKSNFQNKIRKHSKRRK